MMMTLADILDIASELAIYGGWFLILLVGGILYWWWKNKRVITPMKRAIDSENTAAFEALVHKHYKALCHEDNLTFVMVFDYLVERNCLPCMRVLLSCDTASAWQQVYLKQDSATEGPLWETLNFGSLEMLRLLLEQGMQAESERTSPWLWAVSCGLVEHARLLDAFGANTITPEQQRKEKTLDEELLDEAAWENDRQHYIDTIDYLTERRYPVPEAAKRIADQWRTP